MIWHGWVFIGLTALVFTLRAANAFPREDDDRAIVYGSVGFLSSLLFAYQSLNVVVYEGGSTFTHQYPAMALFGVALAMPNLYIVLTGPIAIVGDRVAGMERDIQ